MKKILDFLFSDRVYMILVLLSVSYLVHVKNYSLAVVDFGLFIIIALKYVKNESEES